MGSEVEPQAITESRNPTSENIDALPTLEMLSVINDADAEIAGAVRRELPAIARAVDSITERIDSGGRMFYIGAGTSGRLGVLDASECPPTFNTPPDMVQGLIAGGDIALRHSVERAEDDAQAAIADLRALEFNTQDALVGIAASGRTPYVLGGVEWARREGACTVALTCSPDNPIGRAAEVAINVVVGPEVITGSTRMRAGTATKLVLNMISTVVMIRLGYVYGNLMVNVQPTNAKLVDRAQRIIAQITGLDKSEAATLLETASGSVRVAVLMQKLRLSRGAAEVRLAAARGSLRRALELP